MENKQPPETNKVSGGSLLVSFECGVILILADETACECHSAPD